jgi:hypothetical protein
MKRYALFLQSRCAYGCGNHERSAFGRGCVKTQIATPLGSDRKKTPWDFDVPSEVLKLRGPI